MLDRLFHVNICVRDMERSIRFYQQLGFNKVNDFTAEDPGIGDGLGVKANKIRGEHLGVLRGDLTTKTARQEHRPALWLGGMKGGLVMLDRLFHVNICVRDMERSIRFYQQLGFNKVNDFTAEDPGIGDGLGVKANKIRGVFMRLGDDPNAPVLDLVQFIDPPTQGQPYSTLNNVGICRIAFAVKDIERAYADLKKMDVQFVAPLKTIDGPGGGTASFVCFKDPDGTILELISGL